MDPRSKDCVWQAAVAHRRRLRIDAAMRTLARRLPVLVEAALDSVVEVLRPDGVERAQAARGLDVADNTDDDHGGRLDDRHRLASLLLMQLGAGLLHLAQDVG